MVMTIALLLDAGLTATLNRELSRLRASSGTAQQMHDTLRSVEIPYWFVSGCVALTICLLSGFLSRHWVHSGGVPEWQVARSIALMGIITAFQLPAGLYSGGLLGLQRMTRNTSILFIGVTLRHAGSLLLLMFVWRGPESVFAWQVVSAAVVVISMRWSLAKFLPPADAPARFKWELIAKIRGFAAHIAVIAVLSTACQISDRLIMTKLLSLESLSVYSLCIIAISSIGIPTTTVYAATFARFSHLLAVGKSKLLNEFYHKSCQTISVLVFPLVAILFTFAPQVFVIWTGNTLIAERATPILRILIIGTTFNALAIVPFAITIARGKTKAVIAILTAELLFILPLTTFMTLKFDMVGAAVVNLGFHLIFLVWVIPAVSLEILPNTFWQWLVKDVGSPSIAAVSVAVVGKLIMPENLTRATSFAYIASCGLISALLTVIASPAIFHVIIQQIKDFVSAAPREGSSYSADTARVRTFR
jgi:O-antigen/teichoic acid export membrane protein